MVALTAARIARSANAVFAPVTTVICLSSVLMFVFILYQPNSGPGIIQRVGWQSWDVVGDKGSFSNVDTSVNGGDTSTNPPATIPDGVDWWNVSNTDAGFDSSSFPLDIWAPLMPHDTGLSEISVAWCSVNPAQNWGVCDPQSSNQEDSHMGKWVRVERNLNLEGGFLAGYLNVYYRRTRRQDVPLITEIQLLAKDERPSGDEWRMAAQSLRSGAKGDPLYLWYKLGKTSSEMTAEEKAQIVSEFDVLYGQDVPWYGFEKLEPPTMNLPDREPTYLTVRHGVKVAPKAPPLHFSHDGHFRILQVADLHYSVSQGVCRDTREPCFDSDNMTNTLLMEALDAEQPDLVVFSGDQLNGQGTSWDPKSVLAKFARAVTDRQIPWAAVFGNHDSEVGAEREEQVQMMRALPYSLVERGPADVHGVGNYVLKVKSADTSMSHLLTLYFLDSGSYSKGYWNFWGMFTPTAYDWLRETQVNWFLQESASISPIERPYSPGGSSWKRQGEQMTPSNKRLAKPNALMFFHMPLPESYEAADRDAVTNFLLDKGLHELEPAGSAKKSDGFFEKALLSAKESDHVASSFVPEVKVIGNGHCHLTENCRRVQGVWLCFGGGGSYSGYGRVGFDRRFRVYDVSDYGETIRTYKHTEAGRVMDDMILSGKGAPALP